MHALTTVALLALSALDTAVATPRVRVPLAPAPQVDGRLDAGEWAQAHRVELRDGCAAAELVHGSTPEELVFEPESWSALELVTTNSAPGGGRLGTFRFRPEPV